jgi:chemotaxis protein CheX
MNVNYLNPFIDAAVDVLKAEVGLSVQRASLDLQKSSLTTEDITVLLHLVGSVYGVVLYSLPFELGLKLVSIMMGQDFTVFDSLAQSGIAELGNVITGRATIRLSQAGYQTNISPPAIIIGKGVQISTLDFSRIVVPMNTGTGIMTIHLALREQAESERVKPEDFVPLTIRN